MMRAIQMVVACVAVLAATAGQVQAGIITTQFNSNNGQSGNMFDVEVSGNSLLVTSLDLNLAPGLWDIKLYTKMGTYQGFETNPAAWTLVDSVAGVFSNGKNNPTPVDFLDFGLLANTRYGIYVTTTSTGSSQPGTGAMRYTDGSAVGNIAASNSDLSIFQGAGINYPFGETYEPRIWNGSIHYNVQSVSAVPEPSSLAMFGIVACVAGLGAARRRRCEKQQKATA